MEEVNSPVGEGIVNSYFSILTVVGDGRVSSPVGEGIVNSCFSILTVVGDGRGELSCRRRDSE